MLSRGIRIYFHPHVGNPNFARLRESYNFSTGIEIVLDIMFDSTIIILAIGSEEGAMTLHYTRDWRKLDELKGKPLAA